MTTPMMAITSSKAWLRSYSGWRSIPLTPGRRGVTTSFKTFKATATCSSTIPSWLGSCSDRPSPQTIKRLLEEEAAPQPRPPMNPPTRQAPPTRQRLHPHLPPRLPPRLLRERESTNWSSQQIRCKTATSFLLWDRSQLLTMPWMAVPQALATALKASTSPTIWAARRTQI